MAEEKKIKAEDLLSLLKGRYESGAGWIVFEEVRNGTGHGKDEDRIADAIALQTFPSRGICAHGFEIKVSKRDLTKELRDVNKADAIQKWCDYWWLVVPSEDLIKDVVIPELWGILIASKGKLKVLREAAKLTPEPWTPRFVAAVLRAYQRGLVPKRELDELNSNINQEVIERLNKKLEETVEWELRTAKQSLDALREKVKMFEEASGLTIEYAWDFGDAGKVVKALKESRDIASALDTALRRTKTLKKSLEEAITEISKSGAVLEDVSDQVGRRAGTGD